jgi:uncharacterized membrane protein HdeD (DUF308 family)
MPIPLSNMPVAAWPFLVMLFCGLFGLFFLIAGARRIAQSARSPKRKEELLWGTIGVVIGFAFWTALAVLMH